MILRDAIDAYIACATSSRREVRHRRDLGDIETVSRESDGDRGYAAALLFCGEADFMIASPNGT